MTDWSKGFRARRRAALELFAAADDQIDTIDAEALAVYRAYLASPECPPRTISDVEQAGGIDALSLYDTTDSGLAFVNATTRVAGGMIPWPWLTVHGAQAAAAAATSGVGSPVAISRRERETWGLLLPDGRVLTQGYSQRTLTSPEDVRADFGKDMVEQGTIVPLTRASTTTFLYGPDDDRADDGDDDED